MLAIADHSLDYFGFSHQQDWFRYDMAEVAKYPSNVDCDETDETLSVLQSILELPNEEFSKLTSRKRPLEAETGSRKRLLMDTQGNLLSNEKARPLTSKYKGVCWYKRTKRWVVQVKLHGIREHVGYFQDELEAARAYRKFMLDVTQKLQLRPEQGGVPEGSGLQVENNFSSLHALDEYQTELLHKYFNVKG